MTSNLLWKASWPPSLKVNLTSNRGTLVGMPPPTVGRTMPFHDQGPKKLEATRVSSKSRIGAEKDRKVSVGLAGR